jgi:hypothetical protein
MTEQHSDYWQTTLPAEFRAGDSPASVTPEGGTKWDDAAMMRAVAPKPKQPRAVAIYGYSDGSLVRSTDSGRFEDETKEPDGKAITHIEWDHAHKYWWEFWRKCKWFVWALNERGERWLSRDDGKTWEQEIFVL